MTLTPTLIARYTEFWFFLLSPVEPDSHRLLCESLAKRVLAFDSLCGAQTGVAKRVLAFV